MGLSKELSCEAGSLSCCCPNPHGCFQSEVWGFISPHWSPGLHSLLRSPAVPEINRGLSLCKCGATGSASHHFVGCASCSLAWPAPFHNPPPRWVCQPPPCCESSPPQLPVSVPPTGLDECFFFISLVVGLLYSSIFCQFWLFFVFKLLLSLFWSCKEVQCVHLCLHVSRTYALF